MEPYPRQRRERLDFWLNPKLVIQYQLVNREIMYVNLTLYKQSRLYLLCLYVNIYIYIL